MNNTYNIVRPASGKGPRSGYSELHSLLSRRT